MNDHNIGHTLTDEKLEEVTGGVSTKGLRHVKEWEMACTHYECKLCGMRGTLFAGHKDGCAVKNFPYSSSDGLANGYGSSLNFCWSCKYAFHSSGDPSNHNDLCCGRG